MFISFFAAYRSEGGLRISLKDKDVAIAFRAAESQFSSTTVSTSTQGAPL